MPRFPHVAPSTVGLSDQVFSGLAARARAAGGRVVSLHVGDTYLEPLAAARAEAQRSADHPRLHNYAPVQGEPALLDAIQAHLHARARVEVERECVQVTCGATSGCSIASETLLSPGDDVLVLAPYWPLIRGIVRKRGARAVEVPFYTRLDEPGFDAEAALEAAVSGATSALYVNTPNNPSGRVLSAAALDAIARVAARHALWVLSDEVYDEIRYGDAHARPLWAHPGLRERTLAAHSLSKAYGLAGARVGFLHGPSAAMRAVRGVQTFATYCAPRPLQLGAARALSEGGAWLADARARYAQAGARAAAALGVAPPQGGTFLFIDVRARRRAGESTLGLLERCLDAGVLLTPGAVCGDDFEGFVRACFTCVPPDELELALERLAPLLGA